MVTTPEAEDEETREERAMQLARTVIAGHPQGAIRRIVLYLVVGVSLPLVAYAFVFAVITVAALVLLVATDQLL